MTPDFDHDDVVTLAALGAIHDREGRVTIRGVADATGIPLTTTYTIIRRLADAGLVAWNPGSVGTLHPTCQPVAIGSPP